MVSKHPAERWHTFMLCTVCAGENQGWDDVVPLKARTLIERLQFL